MIARVAPMILYRGRATKICYASYYEARVRSHGAVYDRLTPEPLAVRDRVVTPSILFPTSAPTNSPTNYVPTTSPTTAPTNMPNTCLLRHQPTRLLLRRHRPTSLLLRHRATHLLWRQTFCLLLRHRATHLLLRHSSRLL